MSNTKKGFLKASAILTIIPAVMGILLATFMLFVPKYINVDVLLEACEADPDMELIETDSGYTFVIDAEEGLQYDFTAEEFDNILSIARTGVYVFVAVTFVYMAVLVALSVKILKRCGEGKCNNGPIVALLVLSVIGGNFLAVAFTIVALCIKDQPAIDLNDPKVKEVLDSIEQDK